LGSVKVQVPTIVPLLIEDERPQRGQGIACRGAPVLAALVIRAVFHMLCSIDFDQQQSTVSDQRVAHMTQAAD